MKTKYLFPIIVLFAALLLSACASASAQELNDPTALPPVEDFAVIAEGRLVPNESVQLAFVSSGQVDEILVSEGDRVKAGEPIARLGDRETLEANLAAAEMEALTAGLELTAANLEGVDLRGACLMDAWLLRTRLAGADLTGATLDGADLHGASVHGARMPEGWEGE